MVTKQVETYLIFVAEIIEKQIALGLKVIMVLLSNIWDQHNVFFIIMKRK